jgi:hypothetical protein
LWYFTFYNDGSARDKVLYLDKNNPLKLVADPGFSKREPTYNNHSDIMEVGPDSKRE